jgi:hypothetical protein
MCSSILYVSRSHDECQLLERRPIAVPQVVPDCELVFSVSPETVSGQSQENLISVAHSVRHVALGCPEEQSRCNGGELR